MKTVGVIGLRGMGASRLKHLAGMERVRVEWLCTRDEAALAELGSEFGVDKTTTDWRAMLADESLDAVCVCTPNYLHAPMAEAAMLAGKDVLLEYPMGITLDEVDHLVAVAGQTGRVCHLGATTRHEPQHLAVANRLGELGEPVELRGVLAMPAVAKWYGNQDMIGSFFALANFHFVDQVVDWFGPPAWVSGSLWQRQGGGEISAISASMFFGYERGLSAHVNYTMGVLAQRAFMQFELIGVDGRMTWRERVLEHNRRDGSAETIVLDDSDSCQRDTEQFVAELLGEPMAGPPAAAAVSTRVCLLAEQSARSGHVTLAV
ncbi:MAG TPA: Gfo/Idh/MocA family oxidoreductase [Phycisphaerae bacterium]|nr:Gfo/Idh/MocA family oxidoreductase [Phycisphaerae bacterium]